MLLTLTLDDAKKIGREEGWEEGRHEGVAIGEARGEAKILDLLAKGYTLEQIKKTLKK